MTTAVVDAVPVMQFVAVAHALLVMHPVEETVAQPEGVAVPLDESEGRDAVAATVGVTGKENAVTEAVKLCAKLVRRRQATAMSGQRPRIRTLQLQMEPLKSKEPHDPSPASFCLAAPAVN